MGIAVAVKGHQTGTLSDENGFFKLQNISSGQTIHVSGVGYEPKEILAKTGYYTITMDPSPTSLNDVVVSGYGTPQNLAGRASGVEVSRNVKREKESIQNVSVITQFQPTTYMDCGGNNAALAGRGSSQR